MTEAAKVFVRGLRLEAEIGVHGRELGRRQPLVIDIELEIELGQGRGLGETVDYERIAAAARALAAEGHIGLVETFARDLGRRLLDLARVRRARVRVEKPEALAPQAAGAGVEIIVTLA